MTILPLGASHQKRGIFQINNITLYHNYHNSALIKKHPIFVKLKIFLSLKSHSYRAGLGTAMNNALIKCPWRSSNFICTVVIDLSGNYVTTNTVFNLGPP